MQEHKFNNATNLALEIHVQKRKDYTIDTYVSVSYI